MKNNKIYRKDGNLTVQFTINRKVPMLEMEEQIESLLNSMEEQVSELEKVSIKEQLLNNALKEER